MMIKDVVNEKVLVKHGFLTHTMDTGAETVIIGTFNPGCICNIEFFYSGARNRLWRLLPAAFGEEDLRKASRDKKIKFSWRRGIEFIDIISEVEVEKGQECNRNDSYIDPRVTEWRDVIQELGLLRNVKRICFTRRTFNKSVYEIALRVTKLKEHFGRKFRLMPSPAWYPVAAEQAIWTEFLHAA